MTSIEPLPNRLTGASRCIPESLAELAGPDRGQVSLPVRLAWSGPISFDVSDHKERLTLYRTLLDCGQREDIVRYVNAELLQLDWPRIRRLTGRRLVSLWEQRLPELVAAS
ncbi:MAG: hypothetical protein QOE51_2471 [Actinoplanes sp.]|jgi:hypothetical protein|nr:hypothetical protein [Actinoplanes sp.]